MNKKLLRSLISITSMVGIVTPIPFTVSACWTSEEPIELKCNDETIPGDITGDINTSIAATASLSGHIETNTGESVSDVTFTCEGLKEQTGLDINETTGVINGTLTKKPTNPEFKIKFTANVHAKQLEGYTNPFTVTANPTELECNDATIPGNITGDINTSITATASLSGHIETNTGESVSGVTFSCEGLNQQTGLNINTTTGVINGTLTKKPTSQNFRIKFTANVHGKQLEGYTNPFTVTVNPTELECNDATIPGNITGNVNKQITTTTSLLNHIKTNTGESVSGVTFACDGLPNGLSINQSTGAISGAPQEETSSKKFTITFYASIDGKRLEGQIDKFTTSIGPEIPSSLTSEVSVYDEIRSTTTDVATQELRGNIKTNTGIVVNKADHGLRFTLSQGSLPSGLSFNSDTGVISGTCTTAGTYKFKITANATVYGAALSYQTREFAITISNTILPDTVYKFADSSRTILTGFTDEFIDNHSAYNSYNTMQIMGNVTSIAKDAFHGNSVTTIPEFIKNLTFADGSQCSSIQQNAFLFGSRLTSVILPNSLREIGACAFLGCSSLTSMHWNLPTNYSTAITLGEEVFTSMSTGGTFKCSTAGVDLNNLKSWLEGKGFPTDWTFTR